MKKPRRFNKETTSPLTKTTQNVTIFSVLHVTSPYRDVRSVASVR